MVSPPTAMTRLMKSRRVSLGYLNTMISPRLLAGVIDQFVHQQPFPVLEVFIMEGPDTI